MLTALDEHYEVLRGCADSSHLAQGLAMAVLELRGSFTHGVLQSEASRHEISGMGDLKGFQRMTIRGVLDAVKLCDDKNLLSRVMRIAEKSWNACWNLGHVLAIVLASAVNPAWSRIEEMMDKDSMCVKATDEFIVWGKELHEEIVLNGTLQGSKLQGDEFSRLMDNLSQRKQ